MVCLARFCFGFDLCLGFEFGVLLGALVLWGWYNARFVQFGVDGFSECVPDSGFPGMGWFYR